MIFPKKKVERSLDTQKYILDSRFDKEEEEFELEKNDFMALVISAFIVFLPIVIIIFFIMFLLTM